MKLNLTKIISFNIFQSLLSQPTYLIHFNSAKQLYIDLNVFKCFEFKIIIYYIKKFYINIKKYFIKVFIQFIMFLSRLLKSAKIYYWSTELKLADIVWVIWKIKYLIELLNFVIIIYINYKANIKIIKQILLFIMLIKKLNFHLIYISKYLQHFNLNIHYKLDKQHIISDTLL